MLFLQDIGVGVKVVCFWCVGKPGTEPTWCLRRMDTKQEFSVRGGLLHERSLYSVEMLVEGINLGLRLQDKFLFQMGYTKLDVVEAIKYVYYTPATGFLTEDPFPHKETKDHRMEPESFRFKSRLPEFVFNESSLDRKRDNVGILYEVCRNQEYEIAGRS